MNNLLEFLPEYRSHKVVRAAKIVKMLEGDRMLLDVRAGPNLWVHATPTPSLFSRYRPKPGDYYVVYEDGYVSISPKAAFEEGYSRAPSPSGASCRVSMVDGSFISE
jgi:hypothetical protein